MKRVETGENRMLIMSSLFAVIIPLSTMSFAGMAVSGEDPNDTYSIQTLDDLHEFVKNTRPSYFLARKYIRPEHIPLLHAMLSDEKWSPYWREIALIIGKASDDVNSVPVLLDYFQRADYDNFTDGGLDAKIGAALGSLGRFNCPLAREILTKAVTHEGAIELAKNWINSDVILEDGVWGSLWMKGSEAGDVRERTISLIRDRAVRGLMYSMEPWVTTLLRDLLDNEIEKYGSDDSMFSGTLVDTLAKRDYIQKHGLDDLFEKNLEEGVNYAFLREIRSYENKYSPHRRESDTEALKSSLLGRKNKIKKIMSKEEYQLEKETLGGVKTHIKTLNLGEDNTKMLFEMADEILAGIQIEKSK